MKKIINFLLSAQAVLLLTASALLFSSCIIVGTDDEPDIVVEHKNTTKFSKTDSDTETPSGSFQSPTAKHKIICRNETSLVITDWCVKKDNIVTFANSSFTRAIQPGKEDMIPDLPEGYYVVYFSFEDDYQLDPWDYHSSESIYLDRDVTYCLFQRNSNYGAECRAAGQAPEFYLKGSDGSEIELSL